MVIAIKFGGSLLFNKKGDIDSNLLQNFVEIIKSSKNIKSVVTGGGILARKYISYGRSLGINESYLDLLGIEISRVNARLLIGMLGNLAYPVVIKSIDDAKMAFAMNKVGIAGGFLPGQSTTSVVLQIAESINVNHLIILSDVDGIYDKNPKLNDDAKKFNTINTEELEGIILNSSENQASAGEYRIFDAVSLQLFKRNDILVRLINGKDMGNLKKLLKDDFQTSKIGTLISKV
jgi:uridylate kinase